MKPTLTDLVCHFYDVNKEEKKDYCTLDTRAVGVLAYCLAKFACKGYPLEKWAIPNVTTWPTPLPGRLGWQLV